MHNLHVVCCYERLKAILSNMKFSVTTLYSYKNTQLHGQWNVLSGHILQQVVHRTLAPITSQLLKRITKCKDCETNNGTAAPRVGSYHQYFGIKSSMNKRQLNFTTQWFNLWNADCQILPKPSHQSKRFQQYLKSSSDNNQVKMDAGKSFLSFSQCLMFGRKRLAEKD